MKKAIFLFLLLFLCALNLSGASFDEFIGKHGRRFGKVIGKSLYESFPNSLHISDSDQTQLRYAVHPGFESLTFADLPLSEVIFQLDGTGVGWPERKLVSVQASVYNRGDNGVWQKAQFESALRVLRSQLFDLSRDRSPRFSRRRLDSDYVQQQVWRSAGYDVALRWSGKGDDNEFITLLFATRGAIGKLSDEIRVSWNPRELRERKIKERDGTVRLDIPAVSQGGKGYCVAATLERVLKYFGSTVDQHLIAQLAETDAQLGTDIRVALQALKQVERRLNVKVQELYSDDDIVSIEGWNNILKQYNRVAKKENKSQLPNKLDVKSGFSGPLAVLLRVEQSVFIASRQKRGRGPKWFMQEVRASIDRSYPLCWSVVILPGDVSDGVMTAGFHMRLISGYNLKDNTIVYTDTWGVEKTTKTMPLEEAWAKTTNLIKVAPR